MHGFFLAEKRLDNANLERANLTGVDLRAASLTGANLAGARLDKAILFAADLKGADFEPVRTTSTRRPDPPPRYMARTFRRRDWTAPISTVPTSRVRSWRMLGCERPRFRMRG
jgi:hypothetical protein